MIKVSLVVPVYNVSKYLSKCLDSLISQTYKNLEIIVIDDGSTDDSGLICDSYQNLDSRIRVIHQNNQGLSRARNRALDMATGEYVSCVDSDDYIDKKYVELLLDAVVQNDCDIAVCGTQFCDKDNRITKIDNSYNTLVLDKYSGMKNMLTNQHISTTAWGKLIKNDLYKDVRYPCGKYHEDVYTTYKLLAKAERIVVIPDKLYYYREVDSSISRKQFREKHLDAIEGSIEREDFIRFYYPKLLKYAYSKTGHTCCEILKKIFDSCYVNDAIENSVREILSKRLEHMLLYNNCSMKTKCFALIAVVDIRLARKIYLRMFR